MKLERASAAEAAEILPWFEDYLTRPHPELGRDNAVCPFVRSALDAGTVTIEVAGLEEGEGLEELCAAMRAQAGRFARRRPPEGKEGLATLVTLVRGLPEHRTPLLDEAHRRVKRNVVADGLMIGQFHPGCPEPAARNPGFAVSRAPRPLFAIRHMALHDILFLHADPATFAAYQERFADRYSGDAAHVDPRFAELYRAAAQGPGTTATKTPYIDYQSIDVLLSLQHPHTRQPAEMSFYLVGQVKELLFKLVYEEACAARLALVEDRVDDATWALRRVCRTIDLLADAWSVLETISPPEFGAFRGELDGASGIDSYMYRMVEFVLGHKSEQMARRHAGVPGVAEQVYRALRQTSLYDEATALLARRGTEIGVPGRPGELGGEALRAAWAALYRDRGPDDDLFRLAEALTDVAAAFGRWRSWHLLTVERTIGGVPGTGGTAGVGWLRRSVEHRFFPELWQARSDLRPDDARPALNPEHCPVARDKG
ncbi:tryptophan 2,3-dioxygenase [Nonomuraea sp. NPDC001831]|uniref:tryptophan 2,3-dioxygenase n=1 Tax=Nonomuraea sp. NPDC001831 TaxID=3364340 RepID=UPI0036791E53